MSRLKKRASLRILAGILVAVLVGVASYAQKSNEVRNPALKVDVDLVLVNATVTDPKGRYVMSLDRKHFRVWEDNVEQEIQFFSSEEVPMSLGIVLDVSNSMKDKLTTCRAAAAACLRSGTHLDEYFLLEFSDRVHITQDFTSDVKRLQNEVIFLRAGGPTALYDAVYLGLGKIRDANNARKALLIITDGEDNYSRHKFSDVREFVKGSDVQIYAIGIVDDSRSTLAVGKTGRSVIEELVDITGGRAFFPTSTRDLEDITTKIAFELKHQYIIGYSSTNKQTDGKWRAIRLNVDPPKGKSHLSVRAKGGYFSDPPGPFAPRRD